MFRLRDTQTGKQIHLLEDVHVMVDMLFGPDCSYSLCPTEVIILERLLVGISFKFGCHVSLHGKSHTLTLGGEVALFFSKRVVEISTARER